MENNEIDRKALMDRTEAELHGLPAPLLHLALLQYALDLTILARAYFVEQKHESARDCNETLHRILGFLRNELGSAPRRARDSMSSMLVKDAHQGGRFQILRHALEQV